MGVGFIYTKTCVFGSIPPVKGMAYSKNSLVTYGLLLSRNDCGMSFVCLATLPSSTTSTSQLYVSDNFLLRIIDPF